MNAVVACCAPESYQLGTEAVAQLKQGNCLHSWHDNVDLWHSVFSGIQVIVNRNTPAHRDAGAAAPVFDLLVSAGTHQSAVLTLGDVQAKLSYKPGTLVLLCGRVLKHQVATWKEGERICMAHFMRDNVHDRLEIPRPGWVRMESYRDMMSPGFIHRQNW